MIFHYIEFIKDEQFERHVFWSVHSYLQRCGNICYRNIDILQNGWLANSFWSFSPMLWKSMGSNWWLSTIYIVWFQQNKKTCTGL